jgi:hypothetical protein
MHTVMRLMRTDQGWKAQIDGLIDVAQGEVNHVFFDVPSGLLARFREAEANVPFILWPSADTNRAILCVLPQLGSDGKAHLTLTVRLPSAGASQSLSIPDIRLLGPSAQRPVIALPTKIAGQEVRWSRVGRPLPANSAQSQGLQALQLEDYTLHELSASQLQAIWHSRESEEQTAHVLLTRVWIKPDQNGGCSGEVRYWVDPRNRTYITARLPPQCELVGAQLGSRPVTWTEAEEHAIQVLLQPSYLPVQLRMYLRWPEADMPADGTLQLPLPELDAHNSGSLLLGLPSPSAAGRGGRWFATDANQLTSAEHARFLAQAWANMLEQSAPTAADRQTSELATWLPTWRPGALGLDDEESVIASPIENETAGEAGTISVAAFWDKHVNRLRLDPNQLTGRASLDPNEPDESRWFQLNTASEVRVLSLGAARTGRSVWVMPQPLAAGALLIASLLVWLVTRGWLGKRLVPVAEAVWPLWLALAAATWLFLPVVWPSAIIGLCTAIVLWRRYRELRRDRQFVLLPRTLR